MTISPKTRKEIIKLTMFLSESFHSDLKTDLVGICKDESLHIHVDNYEDYFDGMLAWDNKSFHIHLNHNKGNSPNTKRGRFSLGHELGHYFLDAHREGIRSGSIAPHPSNMALLHDSKMEIEADYFASCLLLPEKRLRTFSGGKTFSLSILEEISDSFQVSLTAAAIRFAEIGTHEIMVVFSKNNIVKWYSKSDDFPNLPFRFKVGQNLPPTSVAGEFYRLPNSKYTEIEEVDLDDWFYDKPWAPDTQLYEQCFYSDLYDYVISIIWFE